MRLELNKVCSCDQRPKESCCVTETLTAMNVAGRYRVPSTERAFDASLSLRFCSASLAMVAFSRLVSCAVSLSVSMSLCNATVFLVKLSSLRKSKISNS